MDNAVDWRVEEAAVDSRLPPLLQAGERRTARYHPGLGGNTPLCPKVCSLIRWKSEEGGRFRRKEKVLMACCFVTPASFISEYAAFVEAISHSWVRILWILHIVEYDVPEDLKEIFRTVSRADSSAVPALSMQ